MSELTAADFLVRVRQIGLDPADHDLGELQAAYERLNALMPRLATEAPAFETEVLDIFDPTRPL